MVHPTTTHMHRHSHTHTREDRILQAKQSAALPVNTIYKCACVCVCVFVRPEWMGNLILLKTIIIFFYQGIDSMTQYQYSTRLLL